MKEIAAILDDRSNWATIALAGGLFLLGALLLEAAGFEHGFLKVVLVFISGLAANAIRPLRTAA